MILGGAALTRRYVDNDLRPLYSGKVFYANDAFDGLRFMEALAAGSAEPPHAPNKGMVVDAEALTGSEAKIALALARGETEVPLVADTSRALPAVGAAEKIPRPPFWGSRVVKDIPLEEVFGTSMSPLLFGDNGE